VTQPLEPPEVRNWFQAFAFKWVNLCRYGSVLKTIEQDRDFKVALYELSIQLTYSLKGAWFQP
jgi:hypothetical protein